MCNLPIQGACADCMMRAITLVHAAMPGTLVAMIHDELLAEVPKADADVAVETRFAETFPGAPTGGLVNAHVGAGWAEVH